jgi:hypothetical protein
VRPAPREAAPARALALGVVVALVAALPALALAALALVAVPAAAWVATAAALGATGLAVVAGTVAGGLAARARGPVTGAMLGGGLGLVLVGVPLFVALEPVWWRFAAGTAGPLVVAAAVAYGAPEGTRRSHVRVGRAAQAWLRSPVDLARSMVFALVGIDGARQDLGA